MMHRHRQSGQVSLFRRLIRRISYRRLLPGILILVILLLLSVILFNWQIYSRVTETYGHLTHDTHQLATQGVELIFPLRVFNNIATQMRQFDATAEPPSQERLDALILAYSNNRVLFLETLDNMILLTRHMDAVFHGWMATAPWNQQLLDPELHSLMENLILDLVLLQAQAENFLPPPDVDVAGRLAALPDTASTQETVRTINEDINRAHSLIIGQSMRMTQRSIVLINTVLLLMFLAILALSGLLYRLLHYGIRFVEKGFDLLNQHRYEESELPGIQSALAEEVRISNIVRQVFREQRLLQETQRVAGSKYVLEDVIDELFLHLKEPLSTDRIGVAFVDPDRGKVVAEHGVVRDGFLLLGPGFESDLATSRLGEVLKSGTPFITEDLRRELDKKPGSQALRLLVQEGIRSNMVLPLFLGGRVFAFLFFSSRKVACYGEKDLQIAQNIASELSSLLDKTFLTKTIFSKITNTFADLVDRKDNETGDHIQRMVAYSVLLARDMLQDPDDDPDYQVNGRFVRAIANNAAIHDIGKVGIPDAILKKPGKLDSDEWQTMKTHAAIGGDIFLTLKDSLRIFNQDFYQSAEAIARHHHEKWDGSGYPIGLSGKEIPLEARIVAVADVFDALSSKRVYKEAWPVEEAFLELERSAGNHLDPLLVARFLRLRNQVLRIYGASSTKLAINSASSGQMGS